MATCTLVFQSNSDGSLQVTSTSAPAIVYGPTTNLKACVDWAKGVVFQTLVGGNNVIASD